MESVCELQGCFTVEGEYLRRHTSFRIGGPARFFCQPPSSVAFIETIGRCRRAGIPFRVLGRGTNVLVADDGVPCAVVSTHGMRGIAANGTTITACCGAGLPRVLAFAAELGLSGLEPLAGIPGSIGGAVRMNAGTRHGCIDRLVQSVTVLTADDQIAHLSAEEVGFGYRSSGLNGSVVLSATLKLEQSDRERVTRLMQEYRSRKAATQPLGESSAGCVFKNPPGGSAGRILDGLGLKGAVQGGAAISDVHANFIVNRGDATAADVRALISRARAAALEALGVCLELEIEIW